MVDAAAHRKRLLHPLRPQKCRRPQRAHAVVAVNDDSALAVSRQLRPSYGESAQREPLVATDLADRQFVGFATVD